MFLLRLQSLGKAVGNVLVVSASQHLTGADRGSRRGTPNYAVAGNRS